MNMSSILSRSCMRKGFFRFVAPLLFSAIALVGALGTTSAYACTDLDVVVHSDQNGHDTYALITYTTASGNQQQTTPCTYVAPFQWQDMGIHAAIGSTMYINFYKPDSNPSTNGNCKAWDQDMSYTITSNQTSSPVYGTCWLNPVNGSWSGCQSTSSTLNVGHWGPV